MLKFSLLQRFTICALCAYILIFTILFSSFSCFASADENPKQVVFVRYNLKEGKSSTVIEGFKRTMAKRGYTEGKDITYIDFFTHQPEHKSAGGVLDFVDKQMSSADMFITTSWTSIYVRSKLAKSQVPQLFVPALKSTVLSMLSSTDEEPDTNLSGVYLTFPPEKILQLAKRILPKIRKYGFVYDSRIPADIVFKAAYGQLNENERHGITIYFLDLANGTDTVQQKMNKMGIEAFGGAVGTLQNLKELSKVELPIITVLLIDRNRKSLVKFIKGSNVIAGLFSPFDSCGQQAAEIAADIFDGKTSIEKSIPQPAQQLTVVNLVAAKRLKQTVPFPALEAADIVIK